MGAVAGIASSVLSSAAQSGQKDNTNNGQVSQATNIAGSNNGGYVTPTSNSPQVTGSSGGQMDWGQMAQMVKSFAGDKDKEQPQTQTSQAVMF